MIQPAAEPTHSMINPDRSSRDSHPGLFRLIKIIALASMLAFVLVYWQSRATQLFAVACFYLIGFLLAYAGQMNSGNGSRSAVGFYAIASISVMFAAPALLLKHSEVYLLIAGLLAAVLAGNAIYTILIQRLAAVASFLLLLLAASTVNIFIKYDIHNSTALRWYLSALTILITVSAAWKLVRSVRLKSIRSRLTTAFVAVAVIPLVIAAAAASSINTRATEDRAVQLLTTVIDLKSTAVRLWLNNLKQTVEYAAAINKEGYTADMLLTESSGSENQKILHDVIQQRLIDYQSKDNNILEYFILNSQGVIVLSTNHNHEGLDLRGESFFLSGMNGKTIHPIENIDALGGSVLLVIQPLSDHDQTLGVMVGSASLKSLSDIIQAGDTIGQTGSIHLIASDFTPLSHLLFPAAGQDTIHTLSRGAIDAILGKQDGAGTYENSRGIEMIGAYRWLPELGAAIFAEQTRAEIFSPTLTSIVINTAISLTLVIGAVIFGLLVSNSIGRPLEGLIEVTQKVATGDLRLEAPVRHREDEISILARSFNQMTHQLRILVENLEQRVLERTNELEARNVQLVIASQVGSTITSILDIDDLAIQVVNIIRDRFDLYYVGLFLVDRLNQYAVLEAGTGEAGQEMLARNHRIKIGEGMIGWSILNSKARIAQQAVEDPVRLAIPFLPDTQSEAAIPLRSRGQVIGAFTIQSDLPNAFDEPSVATLQTLADQVAVAIDNARLFAEVQRSLDTTRRAYGELSRIAWLERISARPLKAVCNDQGVSVGVPDSRSEPPMHGPDSPLGNGSLKVAIKVRGTAIGYLHAQKSERAGHWDETDKEMLETLTDQLGAALESARLFEETLTRAERERIISQAANRVRQTLDVETVLKTAIAEMQTAMDLQEVEVQLLQDSNQENGQ